MAKPTDPEVTAEPVTAAEAAADTKPSKTKAVPCPHCGNALREEHDEGDHMHCDSAKCIGCCFEPSADGPKLRAGYPRCPSDSSR